MLTNLAFALICVRASSALVRTSAFLQPVVRGQVYIFEISPPMITCIYLPSYQHTYVIEYGQNTMFVYSINDMNSFEQIVNLKKQVENTRPRPMCGLFVGNKRDLLDLNIFYWNPKTHC